jgi:hypothetical protein
VRAWQCSLAALGAGLVLLFACSGGSGGSGSAAGFCSSKGACANDPAPTQSDITECTALWNDPACGALFQTYVACAAPQEKCTSAGTVDDAATKSAIQAACAAQIANYQSCTNAGPACGTIGEACCSGATPCNGGCCDPGTQKCVGFLQPCSTPGERCSTSACLACGSPGQPCCDGDCDNGCCIGQGSDAGAGDAGSSDAGVCVAAGGSCRAFGNLPGVCSYTAPHGYCDMCGLTSSPCCPGGTCQAGLTCTGTMCQ